MQPTMWTRVLLVLWGLSAGGCYVGYAIAVGPTVDTSGTVGAQLGLRAILGTALDEENAISETLGVQGSLPGMTAAAGGPIVGLDYFHYFEEDEVGLRAGLRAKATFLEQDDGQVHSWVGVGGAVAFLPELDVSHEQHENHSTLGLELEGWYYEDVSEEQPVDLESDALGQFGLNLVFEWFMLDDDPIGW
ncbi:MAG: hypothetical protein JXB32_14525 [Deltaproteobacteria bacterium]|nr:hypothetical protein [Deltaproteobacteria bacterium]